ncbi:hypothetical protein ACJ73_09333 [Blastomyces percursus]|uniref:Uncharacterized protein n=1 Tax=Blastomyces percursus TaxID=1658174 RepID=A0A1J9Q8M7_9EURO|nr:hypothetical protein ACJ73_09333 [Blastomyces percursus]
MPSFPHLPNIPFVPLKRHAGEYVKMRILSSYRLKEKEQNTTMTIMSQQRSQSTPIIQYARRTSFPLMSQQKLEMIEIFSLNSKPLLSETSISTRKILVKALMHLLNGVLILWAQEYEAHKATSGMQA